jgi:hypothetical protein
MSKSLLIAFLIALVLPAVASVAQSLAGSKPQPRSGRSRADGNRSAADGTES